MVHIERIHQTSSFSELALAANTVFYRSYSRRGEKATNLRETWDEICDRMLQKNSKRSVYSQLEEQLQQDVSNFLTYAKRLARFDPRTEKVIRPLVEYSREISFKRLSYESGSFHANDANKTLVINSEAVDLLRDKVPKELLPKALLVFLFHEVVHISQGLRTRSRVKALKRAAGEIGKQRVLELDLCSDFLSARTLSLFLTFEEMGEYNEDCYIRWLNEIWRNVCRSMLPSCGVVELQDQQRMFGYLLMSNLIHDTYVENYPLEFKTELCPVWDKSNLNQISILTDDGVSIPSASINPRRMQQILKNFQKAQYAAAEEEIREWWGKLPRRC